MKSLVIILVLVISFSGLMASETVKGIQKDYESFKLDMKLKLNATEAKINELKLKAQAQSAAAQEKSITEYEQTRDQLKAQLDDIEKAGETKWQKTKRRMAESIDKLNKKVQKSLEESNR
jgi:bacterioferritin (cytochrome b1)